MTAAASRADLLRSTANSFCKAFVSGTSPTKILDDYFTLNASITEHGPSWAAERLPFLGRTFQGRRQQDSAHSSGSTCDDYYDLLTSRLSFHPTEKTLPSSDQFLVDPEAVGTNGKGSVTVKLQAEFKSVKTGKGWEEDFVYVLSEFDGEGKIGCQELWADPLNFGIVEDREPQNPLAWRAQRQLKKTSFEAQSENKKPLRLFERLEQMNDELKAIAS